MGFDKLVEQQPLLQETLETIRDGIVTIEEPNTFTYANCGAEKLLGVGRDEIKGQGFESSRWKLLSDEGKPLTGEEEPFSRVLREEAEGATIKVRVLRPDGSSVPVLLNISPFSADGALRGVVGVFTDISAMEEIEQLRSDYQQTISHDLRTPLTAILGYGDLLQRLLAGYDLPSEVERAVDSILQAGRRMLTMLNDLLTVSRIETDGIPLDSRAVDLPNFLRELVEKGYAETDLRRIELHLPDDLPPVNADPDKLGRVVENLLGNALAYSGKEVKVAAESTGDFVRISVADRGEGVAPEQIPHMFKRYHRIDSRARNGFGLGLFIVLLFTQAHGGHVYACSEPGEGMTFSVYFPVHF